MKGRTAHTSAAGRARTTPESGGWKPTREMESSEARPGEVSRAERPRQTRLMEAPAAESTASCGSHAPGKAQSTFTKAVIHAPWAAPRRATHASLAAA